MKEIWKNIKGYNGKYQVSNKGRVRTHDYKRTGTTVLNKLNPSKSGNTVKLYNDGYKGYMVYRLVYACFNGETLDNNQIITHIDGNKFNDSIDNLKMISNGNHRKLQYAKGILKAKRLSDNKASKCVQQLSEKGKLIRVWNCIKEAELELGIFCIGKACRKERPTVGGFKWRYIT